MVTVRPRGLLVDLLLTGAVVVGFTWNPAVPWWAGIPVAGAGAALFYSLRRCARRLADAQAAAVQAGMYAARAEKHAAHSQVVVPTDAENDAARAAHEAMVQNWENGHRHGFAIPPNPCIRIEAQVKNLGED